MKGKRFLLGILALGLVFGFGLAGCSSDSSAPGFPADAKGDYSITSPVKTPAGSVTYDSKVAVDSTTINSDPVTYEYIATVNAGMQTWWYIRDVNGKRVGVLTGGSVATYGIYLGDDATYAGTGAGQFTVDSSIASVTTWDGIASKL